MREGESRRDRMHVEFVALPQEISVAQQNAAGEIASVRVWLWFRAAVPKTLLRLSKQCQNQLPTPTLATTKKIINAA